MTIVAYDGSSLVTDSQSSWGNLKIDARLIKIATCGQWVLGMAGDLRAVIPLRYALGDKTWPETDLPLLPDVMGGMGSDLKYEVIAVSHKRLCWYSQTRYPMELEQQIMACGSGCDLAIGAMVQGATALDAARIAAGYDIHCSPPFHEFIYDTEALIWDMVKHDR